MQKPQRPSKPAPSKRDTLKAERKALAKRKKQKGEGADVEELQADGFQLLTQEEVKNDFGHVVNLEPNRKKKSKVLPWRALSVPDQFLLGAKEGGFIGLEVLEAPPSNMTKFLGDPAAAEVEEEAEPAVEEGGDTVEQDAEVAEGDALAEASKNAESEPATAEIVEADAANAQPTKSALKTAKRKDKEKTKRLEKVKRRKEEKQKVAEVAKNAATEGEATAPTAEMSPLWEACGLSEELRSGLQRLGFLEPTEVQKRVLEAGLLRARDVLAASETGSGKTLAFGLPIMQQILLHEIQELCCLVLAPTRELAMQVSEHLSAVGKKAGIKVATIVGGIAVQKQERMLNKKPHIIVATPGRLWELMSVAPNATLATLPRIKFLVLDEADRMVESGHFKELDHILGLLAEDVKRQTYVLSATLTAQHRKDLTVVAQLIKRIRFMRPKETVDLTEGKNILVHTLTEGRIVTLADDKDSYLAYFLREYPGRTIVFVNAISTIRRLVPFLQLLSVPVLSLHAQMQQRQRLKNLDRFKAREDTVLVATDVAARGLDVELVKHVVHYQLPKTADLYVHRSGRTARANREGLAILLVSPEDQAKYNAIQKHLGRDQDVPAFPIASPKFVLARKCVGLAKKIDTVIHQQRAERAQDSWVRKSAEEMELDLSEDEMPAKPKSNVPPVTTVEMRELQQQLAASLNKWKIPTGGAVIPDLPQMPAMELIPEEEIVHEVAENDSSGDETKPEEDILLAASIPELRFAKRRMLMEGHADALTDMKRDRKGKEKFGKKHWKRR